VKSAGGGPLAPFQRPHECGNTLLPLQAPALADELLLDLPCAGGKEQDQGELVGQQRHRVVFQVAAVLIEQAGDIGDNAGAVFAKGGHNESLFHGVLPGVGVLCRYFGYLRTFRNFLKGKSIGSLGLCLAERQAGPLHLELQWLRKR